MARFFYIIASTILLIIVLMEGQFVFKPLALGAMIAISIQPAIRWLKKYFKYHWLSFIVLASASLGLFSAVLFLISDQVVGLFSELNTEKFSFAQLETAVVDLLSQFGLSYRGIDQQIANAVGYAGESIGSFLMGGLAAGGEMILTAALSLIFAYYFSSYYRDIKRYVRDNFTGEQSSKVRDILGRMPEVIRAYMNGVSKVMLILGLVMTAFYFAIGLDYAIVWGLLTGLLVFIPYVGSFIALLLPLSYSLITMEGATIPITIIAFYLIVQQIEGNILTPKIVGKKVDLNPFTTIILLLVAGKIWGLLGIFLSIPLGGMIKIAFEAFEKTEVIADFMSEDVNERKGES